jgi:hypothetical protein
MLRSDRAKELCTELVIDVPLARSSGSPEIRLAALLRGALFFPVRFGWTSPVDGWLKEARALAEELDDREGRATVAARHAVVAMRLLRFESALQELDAATRFGASQATAIWIAATRVRVLVRAHRLKEARVVLDRVEPDGHAHWSRDLPALASAELELEGGGWESAERMYTALVDKLDERLIEDHIDVMQALGFCRLAVRDVAGGARRLHQARGILAALGIHSEVAQMDLALGHLYLVLDDPAHSRFLLEEARELAAGLTEPGAIGVELARLSEVGIALAHAQRHAPDQARAAAARAAALFGRSGSAPGYVAMLLLVTSLYENDRDYRSAYRTLAVGLAVARNLGLAQTELRLQREITRLRNEVVGRDRFDALVRELFDELRSGQAAASAGASPQIDAAPQT